jgi:hypothetical protein
VGLGHCRCAGRPQKELPKVQQAQGGLCVRKPWSIPKVVQLSGQSMGAHWGGGAGIGGTLSL